MKSDTYQQELILMAAPSCFRNLLCTGSNDKISRRTLPTIEQLEKACWTGLLDEVVPEIIQRSRSGRKLFIWHIRQGASLLQIQLSEYPLSVEQQFSIDPNFFLPFLFCN